MDKQELKQLTDEELLIRKKKLKNSKIFHATLIGFLAGIILFGVIAWGLSPKKQVGFLIPMLIPIFIIYKVVKTSKGNQDLEEVLKERQLD